jgi:hypothetical protein
MELVPWKDVRVTVLRRSVLGQVYRHIHDSKETLKLLRKFRSDSSDVSIWPVLKKGSRFLLAEEIDWTGFH